MLVLLIVVTEAPDITGYVSTCARDNLCFKNHVLSHFDGLEAAKALRVIIEDLQRKDDVGNIAFASIGVGPERVNMKRLYD